MISDDNLCAIIDQIKGGDEKAFERLFKLYASRLMGAACKMLRSKEMAQDIVQDVFCELWRQRSTLDSSKNANALIYRMLYFKMYDLLRHTKVKAQAAETIFNTAAPENSVENHINFEETKGLLEKALLNLSEQQRTVYSLVKEEGLSYKQAGEQLNISPATINTHMVRVIKTLKVFFGEH